MTLSCSCAEFDPSEHDSWWETGRRSVPPAGSRCCECSAPLPEGEKCQTIIAHTVVEPDEPVLAADPEPEEDDFPDEDGHEFDKRLDAWRDRHGWNSDNDRFEESEAHYRCERCADLADAIEDMGFCMLAPGQLIDAHTEYVNEVQELAPGVVRREIIWSQGKDGVWHPRRKTQADRRRAETIRRWRNIKAWVRYGWKLDLRYKVWPRIARAAGYTYTYDWSSKTYHWKRKPRALPPWEREAMRWRDGE